jgi:hypothetical protein
MSSKELATKFECSKATIDSVRRYKTWVEE